MQAWTQTGILYLTALYFIDLVLPGGQLSIYINVENLGWLTWLAAIMLFLLAISSTVALMRPPQQDEQLIKIDLEYGTAQQRSANSLWSWVFVGVVALPIVFGLGVPAKPLGADAVRGEISSDVTSLGLGREIQPSFDVDPESRNLLDWLRVFGASQDLTEFEGKQVDVVGFVYRDARFRGTEQFMVVRFTLSCCVADARPIGLIAESPLGANFEDDSWVQMTGMITIKMIDGVETPIIIPDSIEPTVQPEQPYLYF